MEIAVVANERALRIGMTAAVSGEGARVHEYATAAHALPAFAVLPFDLIFMDWKVYPGFGSGDSSIEEWAAMIPDAEYNQNLLYWQIALRALDRLRDEKSPNRKTLVIVRFPPKASFRFAMDDQISIEAVETDLQGRGTIAAVYAASARDIAAAVADVLG